MDRSGDIRITVSEAYGTAEEDDGATKTETDGTCAPTQVNPRQGSIVGAGVHDRPRGKLRFPKARRSGRELALGCCSGRVDKDDFVKERNDATDDDLRNRDFGHSRPPSVITLKPATCYQFKTGHFAWVRRDCFTPLQSVGARYSVARRVKVEDAPPGSRLAE